MTIFVALVLLCERYHVGNLVNQEQQWQSDPEEGNDRFQRRFRPSTCTWIRCIRFAPSWKQQGRKKMHAPVIRELLDEALGARRRKALGIADWEEPPGQGKDE